jgi:hypothetical protein
LAQKPPEECGAIERRSAAGSAGSFTGKSVDSFCRRRQGDQIGRCLILKIFSPKNGFFD